MSPTTKRGRIAGGSLAALALLASAPLSIAAGERTTDSPATAASRAIPAPVTTPQVEYTTAPSLTQPAPTQPAPIRLVQADAASRAATASGVRPVYLRISADTDAGFRAAIANPPASGTPLRYEPRAGWVNRTFEVHVTGARASTISVTEDHNTRQVTLDATSRAALEPIVSDCRRRLRANNRLNAFGVKLPADTPTLYGEHYLVYCYPGERIDKQTLTSDRNIEGLLASDAIDESSRNARAAGMFFGHQIRRFEASTPNPTRQQMYENCVAVRSEAKRRFSFPSTSRSTPEQIADGCRRTTDRKFDGAR